MISPRRLAPLRERFEAPPDRVREWTPTFPSSSATRLSAAVHASLNLPEGGQPYGSTAVRTVGPLVPPLQEAVRDASRLAHTEGLLVPPDASVRWVSAMGAPLSAPCDVRESAALVVLPRTSDFAPWDGRNVVVGRLSESWEVTLISGDDPERLAQDQALVRHLAMRFTGTDRDLAPATTEQAPRQYPPPRIPRRPHDLVRWKLAWPLLKAERKKNCDYVHLSTWLGDNHQDLYCSPEIVSDICRAGDAGLLDDWLLSPPNCL